MKRVFSFLIIMVLAVGTACAERVVLGAEQTKEYLPLLKGKRVALLSNHTGLIIQARGDEAKGDTIHTLDWLLGHGIQVTAIFSPEHGFRGTAREGEKVASSVDEKTGIPILSLYDGDSKYPSKESMGMFDVLVTDIQDVGLRFYTYYISMLNMINASADFSRKVIVLDRPNPNGMYVDGPILDMEKYKSGVGALPIPVVHGLTMGEIALMAQGEGWSKKCDVEVVTCKGYTHQTRYDLPIAPSPNLPTQHSIYLYPSTCLFEGTICSLGRGTSHPFECYGHPDYKDGSFTFTPRSVAGAKNPPLKDVECYGVDLRGIDDEQVISDGFNLEYVIDAYNKVGKPEKFFTRMFLLLTGVDYIKEMIIAGNTADEISARWQKDVEDFKVLRRKYLLYEE